MNILSGTYGFDLLSIFILIISLFFNFGKIPRLISLILWGIVVFRAFSKNTYKRSQELSKFTTFINNILRKFNRQLPYMTNVSLELIPPMFTRLKYTINQKIQYKIVACPNCGQKLRLPRRKGKIIATCKRCHNEFRLRT
ncbi:Hypothetical protein CM240_1874 [Clostridium bornimense]|uniref:Zn-finger containing protein n=1 Tax=Clostridium bornimense TaxID=1216932 RepID=W6S3Y5_9CLOT|nr:hypothetical protein [Clostridium bornimense]CDM69032.1 Hypothetical protein CM240_1874 [Clostridium bornimense]